MSKLRLALACMLLALLPVANTQAQTISAQMQAVFDLAAQLYPNWFTNGNAPATYQDSSGTYVYRYFPSSGIYVGIKSDQVYVLGGPFGNSISQQGSVAQVKAFLDQEKIRIDLENSNPDAQGDYDLTITGTVSGTAAGFPFSQPVNVTVKDVPAPDTSDINEIEDLIEDSFDNVGTISQLNIVVVNNSSSRFTFDLTFKASVTSQGFTVSYTYNLRYDYVK